MGCDGGAADANQKRDPRVGSELPPAAENEAAYRVGKALGREAAEAPLPSYALRGL